MPNGLESQKQKELLPFVKLIDKFEGSYHDIANDDVVFIFRTTKDAPKYKLVQVDLKEQSTWTEVLQETEKDVLESSIVVNGDQMVMSNLSDVKHVLQKRNLETGALLHHLPIEIGSVYDVSGRRKDSIFAFDFFLKISPFPLLRHAWTSDYGCSEKEEEFHWLIK
ncbi:hypothetical protein RJ640_023813 [Escallonia rubra]|uniref:Peptidase S9A N-terminal domain-containing protein n=1 Tax=Escallonia rubra TaxID=112253 RepID=A0AA88UVN2_9ASTE|nr:hypothetical protein RJ640_023813 [Escallonia rubra]